jgi:hypothetical protein
MYSPHGTEVANYRQRALMVSELSRCAPVSSARQEVGLASLDLIVTLKNAGPRDQRIGRGVNALEAWKRELATL